MKFIFGGLDLPSPATARSEPPFCLVIMMDGWMARERGADWGAGPRKKNPERVDWKEIKSTVIYRLEQRVENAAGRGLLLEKYTVATPPDTSPVEFGRQVQQEALRRGLARAQVVYLVMDGAVESFGKQLQRRLRGCGQFWSRSGLTSLLHLSVLVKNRDDPHLWN